MATTQTTTDDSTEPEVSDERISEVVDSLSGLIADDLQLSLVCGDIYAQQIDNPLTDDFNSITLFMDGDVGSGATKATIIQKVLDSDVPVRLKNTADGHGQITFAVDN